MILYGIFMKSKFCIKLLFIITRKRKRLRQKGGDLTQSYDKSPYTNRNIKGAK